MTKFSQLLLFSFTVFVLPIFLFGGFLKLPFFVHAATTHVVISQIQIAQTGNANKEFVELYNPTAADVNLLGWKLKHETQNGSTTSAALVNSMTGIIKSHGYFLIGSPSYTGTISADITYSATSSAITSNNTILLSDNASTLIDEVGMVSAVDKEIADAVNPGADQSIIRKASATSTATDLLPGGSEQHAGNGFDDDNNNSTDFVLLTTALPRNSSTPQAPPIPTPTVTPSATPTATPADTPTETPTLTPTLTPTETPTPTPTQIPTATPTSTPLPTETQAPTPTEVPPTQTPTPTPTTEPTATPTDTPIPTPIPTFSLSGVVYVDANQNGVQDNGELGFAGATVSLSTGQTTITDSNGSYSFTGLQTDVYTQSVTLPNGYMATTLNPVQIALTADTTENFGIAPLPTPTATQIPTATPTSIPTSTPTQAPNPTSINTPVPTETPTPTLIPTNTITGNVYIDANHNGVQDAGETNFQGATVTLGGDASNAAITDSNGTYTFPNLSDGSYVVTLALPTGFSTIGSNPVNVSLTADTTVNFGIMPLATPTATPTVMPTTILTQTVTPTMTPLPTGVVLPTPTPVVHRFDFDDFRFACSWHTRDMHFWFFHRTMHIPQLTCSRERITRPQEQRRHGRR